MTIDEITWDGELLALINLEKEMFLQGDARSLVISNVLDCLFMNEVIDDRYAPPPLRMDEALTKFSESFPA